MRASWAVVVAVLAVAVTVLTVSSPPGGRLWPAWTARWPSGWPP